MDAAGLSRPAQEVLTRIARLACRVAAAEHAVVLVRDERDPRRLIHVASHSDTVAHPLVLADHPALADALASGAPVACQEGGGLRAAAPLMWGGMVRGALAAAGGTARLFERQDLEALGELAALASTALEEAEQRVRLEEIVETGVAALVRAVDMRDDYTGEHSASVGDLARRVGERLGMDGGELWLLELAARLHDVGKIGVPDAILNKPGPLDEDEWALMRRHAELGAEMVTKVPGLEPVAPLVRAHHERWDGEGYPDGLARGAIPLASRVIAVCDAFQAMISHRPYRAALDVEIALRELADGAGSHFDPAVVEALRYENRRIEHPAVAS
jgi:HD-GYP domain-containing protein (c-di-GMP phosphodiesterase class II)